MIKKANTIYLLFMKLISNRRFYHALVLHVCLAALAFAHSCNPPDVSAGKETNHTGDEPAVEVIAAKREKLSSSVQIPGELLPYQEVNLYAKENSFVKKVYVDVGS